MMIHTEVGPDTREALFDMAEAEGISRAALIRRILEEATETGEACLKTI